MSVMGIFHSSSVAEHVPDSPVPAKRCEKKGGEADSAYRDGHQDFMVRFHS